MATHVLCGSPLYLADGYCSVYSIHDSVGASDQVAVYTVSDCVTNFAHAQLSCFYYTSFLLKTQQNGDRGPGGLKLHGVKGQRNICACAGRGPGNEATTHIHLLGERERAHLVVQLARFLYIFTHRPCRQIP